MRIGTRRRGRIGGMEVGSGVGDGSADRASQRLQLADAFRGVLGALVVVCVLAMLAVLCLLVLGELVFRDDVVDVGFWVLVVLNAQAEVQASGVEYNLVIAKRGLRYEMKVDIIDLTVPFRSLRPDVLVGHVAGEGYALSSANRLCPLQDCIGEDN